MITDNPIFRREIKAALRSTRNMWVVGLYLAVLGGILMVLWPKSGVFSEVTDSSKLIFVAFLISNLVLVTMLVPALTGNTITMERERRTFDLLFTSLLSPGEILAGKLCAGLALVLIVQLLSLPILVCCVMSGGIGVALMLKFILVSMVAAVTYGLVGMAFSALCDRTFTALILSYIVVGGLAGATWLPDVLLGQFSSMARLWQFLRSLSPFDSIYYLLFPGRYDLTMYSKIGGSFMTPLVCYLIGMAIISTVCLVVFCWYVLNAPGKGTLYRFMAGVLVVLLCAMGVVEWYLIKMFTGNVYYSIIYGTWKLKVACVVLDIFVLMLIRSALRMARRANEDTERYSDLKTTLKRKLTWPFYLLDPQRRKRPIGLFRNPVYVAEMRSKIFGNPKFVIRALTGCLAVSFILLIVMTIRYSSSDMTPDTVRWVAILFQIGIVVLFAPVISSGAITDELSSGTMVMLRITPISPVTVVMGKLKASLVYVSIFLISSLPVLFALTYFESETNHWRVGAWFAILALSSVTFVTAGLCASTIFKTTGAATVASYGVALLICVGSCAVDLPGAFSEQFRQMILTVNPVIAALRVTSDELFSDLPADIWIDNLRVMAALSLMFIVVAACRTYRIFGRQS